MNLIICIVGTLLLIVSVYCTDERPLISIEDGFLRGTFKTSYNGRKYMSFEGIPYAKPPIQKLRFKEPEPVDPWPGILDATTIYTCTQIGLDGLTVLGQEDCLYLNVYVPREKINPEEKLDVIVHIHGGAFMLGSPVSLSGPLYFMDRDIVYVNFNYRVGPFGFYSVGDNVFHGNYGMKDQVAVLEWIKKNIDKFGGNKDSVTLTGGSAGGASVHFHYFSPASKGLFHRGFAQSGVALNPWALKLDPWPSSKVIATEVGCLGENIKVMYRCLKQRTALQINNAVKKLYKDVLLPLAPFCPTTETFVPLAFLIAPPYLQLAAKSVTDVPFLISMTTEEGVLPAGFYYNRIDELNERWNELLPYILEYHRYEEEKRDEVSAKIKEFYFKNENVTKDNYDIFVKLCSQRLFHMGAEKAAKLQANASDSDVYFILMNYAGETKHPSFGTDVNLGIGHGEDGIFYYDITLIDRRIEHENEIRMKDILIDMVVEFAKTGKPKVKGVNFLPVPKSGNLAYLSIKGPDDMSMKTIKRLGPHEFWRSLELKEDENIYTVTNHSIEIR